MTDPTDKRIEELWQYIPPYTAPNHPPQVKVITTTNTGDTPMTEEDPDLLADDGDHDQNRSRSPFPAMSERYRLTEELENARYQNNLLTQKCRELEKEVSSLAANQCHAGYAGEYGHHRCSEIDRLREENRQLRELLMEMRITGVVSEPQKATPPHYDHLQDLG